MNALYTPTSHVSPKSLTARRNNALASFNLPALPAALIIPAYANTSGAKPFNLYISNTRHALSKSLPLAHAPKTEAYSLLSGGNARAYRSVKSVRGGSCAAHWVKKRLCNCPRERPTWTFTEDRVSELKSAPTHRSPSSLSSS